jgi:hypothetical protein
MVEYRARFPERATRSFAYSLSSVISSSRRGSRVSNIITAGDPSGGTESQIFCSLPSHDRLFSPSQFRTYRARA